MTLHVCTLAKVNGYEICSSQRGILGEKTYFVRWMKGEYATQAEAEEAARRGGLSDYSDLPSEPQHDR